MSCNLGCSSQCTAGLSICTGQKTGMDVPFNKTSAATEVLYVYCSCKKSTLARSPGV